MASNVVVDGNGYSRLIAWEVINFMSIKTGRVEFDERNIVNLKGYNDSGKSAMLRALDVLFYNIKPASQVGFIHDNCDYFRIIAYFSDGVTILRDKYVNGQGLYEMYKDNKCIFSTKSGKTLTKITRVPDVVQKYLGLTSHGTTNLNSRSCYEKQLLCETTGSENYVILNETLKTEEISRAGEMLNTDKNLLGGEINSLGIEVDVLKKQYKESKGVSKKLLDRLKEEDVTLSSLENSLDVLNFCGKLVTEYESVAIIPELPEMTGVIERLNLLGDIKVSCDKLDTVKITPELPVLEGDVRLGLLDNLRTLGIELENIHIYDKLPTLNKESEQVDLLLQIQSLAQKVIGLGDIPLLPSLDLKKCDSLLEIQRTVSLLNKEEESLKGYVHKIQELVSLKAKVEAELRTRGHHFVSCKNCGSLVDVTL